MFQRPEGMTNITQLYTAALKEDKSGEFGGKVKPMRNGNITKLYTEGLDKEPERAFKGKPKDEKTNPIKHNLATRVDKAAIFEAYNEVMADNNNIECSCKLLPIKMSKWEMKRKPGQYLSISPP